jgi:hypothetical protein
MEQQTKFYDEGHLAFRAGSPITSNPYKMSVWNAYHGMWRRGWTEAHRVSKLPKRTRPRMELVIVKLNTHGNMELL